MRTRLALLLLLVPVLAPVQAGIIFGRRREPVDPKKRVPELVSQLKSDKDASRRAAAATELRSFDPAAFPDMVPALVSALLSDTHQIVRLDSAQTLSRLRPVQQVVGEALEQALEKDPSMRVRLQARSLLLQYHWAGYKGGKKDVPPLATISGEPPPRGIGRFLPAIRTTPTETKPATGAARTSEPPLAAPSAPASNYKSVAPTPLPKVTVPMVPPALTPAPLPSGPVIPPPPAPVSEGPILP